jgi:hypothetical protein
VACRRSASSIIITLTSAVWPEEFYYVILNLLYIHTSLVYESDFSWVAQHAQVVEGNCARLCECGLGSPAEPGGCAQQPCRKAFAVLCLASEDLTRFQLRQNALTPQWSRRMFELIWIRDVLCVIPDERCHCRCPTSTLPKTYTNYAAQDLC